MVTVGSGEHVFYDTGTRYKMVNPVGRPACAFAIQLALAPVFLLTGIAGMLNVSDGWYCPGRIIDRGPSPHRAELLERVRESPTYRVELDSLEFRRHLASSAITACTLSALLVCTVIAALFVEVLLQVELKWVVGALFTRIDHCSR